MAKLVYRQMPASRELPQQMPAPRELPQQMPSPRAKARMQKPQSEGKCLVQIPGVRGGGGGWLWMKLIPVFLKASFGYFDADY